jgi:hypothetical protein
MAVAATMGTAQTKTTMTGQCGKPDVQQSVPAGDQQGHMYMISQGKCTVTGSINGAVAKQGMYSEEIDSNGTQMKNQGTYVVTFDSGDKAYYKYQGTSTMKDGAYQAGTNKYEIVGGTGKMQGLRGSGGCKLTGTGGDNLDYSCTGTYSIGMATGNGSRGAGRATTPSQNPRTQRPTY